MLVALLCLPIPIFPTSASKPSSFTVDLPQLPPIWEIHKTLNEEDFQPDIVIDDEMYGINADSYIDSTMSIMSLKGFVGHNYATEIDGSNIVILENSLNTSTTGFWEAKGLIRNETIDNVDEVIIEAELISKDGMLLDTISTKSLVRNIRPGEPAPFQMDTTMKAEEVADVNWSFKAIKTSENISREANIMVNYEVPFGEPIYKGIERDDHPYPYVLGTSFDNLGKQINRAELIVAWLDETGRVIWIETSELDPLFSDGVMVDGAALFSDIIVEDAEIANQLSVIPYTLWVVGK